MASTTFVDGETLIEASWLNDVNDAIYNPAAAIIPASSIANTPAGNIAATDVQAALNELDSEKIATTAIGTTVQAYDATLAGVAALTIAINEIPVGSGTDTFTKATLDTTTTLGTSDTKIATQNAVKTYVDARSPVGLNQSWASATIVSGTPYTNSLSKAIGLSVVTGSASITTASLVVDGVTVASITTAANTSGQMSAIIPAGRVYVVTASTGPIVAAVLS